MLCVITLASMLAGAVAVPHAQAEKVKVAFYGGESSAGLTPAGGPVSIMIGMRWRLMPACWR